MSTKLKRKSEMQHYDIMFLCFDFNVKKTQSNPCNLTYSKLKSKCRFHNNFHVQNTHHAGKLINLSSKQNKVNFTTTADRRLNIHRSVKFQGF